MKTTTKLALCIFIALSIAGCRRQSAVDQKKEADRAQKLPAELSKKVESISPEIKKLRDQLGESDPNLATAVPDYKHYHEQLIEGTRQIDHLVELINAKTYGDIPKLSLDGIKNSSAVCMEALAKAKEQLEASIKLIDANKYSEVNQATNKGRYYQALGSAASVQERIFLEIYQTVLLNSSAAERARIFEDGAKIFSTIEHPGGMMFMADSLRRAYAEEDNVDNRAKMRDWLKQYNIPEASATPSPSGSP